MKKISFAIMPALLAMLFASCEKVVEFKPESIEPKVVMISRPAADSNVTVTLSYSRFFLDNNSFRTISYATVKLDLNGNSYTAVPQGNGLYSFGVAGHSGDTMTLTADVPGYRERLVAGTRVPDAPSCIVEELVADTIAASSNMALRLKLKILDETHDKYYRLRILAPPTAYMSGHLQIDSSRFSAEYMSISDPLVAGMADIDDLLDGETTPEFYGRELFFSSDLFTGDGHVFTIDFSIMCELYYLSSDKVCYQLGNIPFKIELQAISPELYKYGSSAVSADDDFYLESLFSEPVQVICNVKGGIGVFGSSYTQTKTARISRYEDFNNGGVSY